MASSPPTLPPAPPPVPRRSDEQLIEFDRFIDAQIKKTRAQVRTIDVASELIVMAAGALGLFLVAAIFDHWIVTGGLGFWSRLAFFIVAVGAGGYYFATRVLPLIIKRINPVYAAHAIERGQPSLKNNLINFLLFRSHQSELSPWVYEGIEEQAARSLAGVSVDASLDRSKLIRFGYVLLGLVVAAAVYKIASPKDPFQTFGRVLIPWADIAAPTDVTLAEIEPGEDITVPRGKPVVVAAHVRGLADDGEAWALYSTADGQIVDRKIPLRVASGDYRHMAELPPGGGGAQQPFTYRVQAGDATTKTYKVDVTEAPTIAVDSIEFEYPSYTGFPKHTTERLGDIKALEGTRVTVRADANQEIGSAQVVFDPRSRLDMKVDGRRATAAWTLALTEDRRAAEHDRYELRFKNQSGVASEDAALHPIEVIADQSPSVIFTAPEQSQLDVPLDRSVVLEVNASDPDFSLRRVMLRATVDGRAVVERPLLDEGHRGPFVGRFRFSPKKLNLKPGAVVSYWAEAEDNRQPKANSAQTDRRTLRIIGAGEASNQPEALAPDHGDAREGDGDKDNADRNQGDPDKAHPPEDQGGDAKRQDQPDANQGGDEARRDQQPPREPNDKPPTSQEKQDQQGDGQQGSGQPSAGGDQSQENQGGDSGEQSDSGDKQQKTPGAASDQSSGEKPDQKSGKNGASESREPVANDGSEDAKALQRIFEEQNKQEPAKGDPKSGDDKNSQPNQGSQPQTDQKSSEKPQNDKPVDKQDARPADKEGNQPPKDGSKPDRDHLGGDKKPDQKSDEQNQPSRNEKDKGQQSQSGGSGAKDGSSSAGDQQSKGSNGGAQSSPQDKHADDTQNPQKDGGSSEQSQGGENPAGGDGQGRGDDQANQNKAAGEKKEGEPGTGKKQGGEPKPADKASEQNNSQGQPQGDTGEKSGQQGQRPVEDAGGQNTPGDRSNSKGTSAKQNANSAGEQSPQDKPEGNSTKSKQAPQGMKAEKKPTDDEATSGDQPKPGPPAAGKQGKSAEKSGDADKNQTPRGESGAGDPNEKPMAAPDPKEDAINKPRSKTERPGDSEQKPSKDEAQAQSKSDHESDSRGDSDGEQSGGGKQGGSQKANQRGPGASGQNTSSDEGAGKSSESGQGEAANRAGDQRADHPTGQQGAQKGNGASSRSSTDGKQAGGDPSGRREGGEGEIPDKPPADSDNPSQSPGVNSPGGRGVNPTPGTGKQTKEVDPKEDAANLEYTRRATDLALERLKDQLAKEKVDPQLLKDLGWSQDDLRRFVDRWESMRRDASAGGQRGAAARKELDDALRGLNLAPRGATIGGAENRNDRSHGLKESRRRDPPPDYDDQFKAYTRGAARGK